MSREQRLQELQKAGYLNERGRAFLENNQPIPNEVADGMIENQIGQFTLPMGVAQHFVVNGTKYWVPMVTEEPSVIAAAGNGARMAFMNGGIKADAQWPRAMIGEIVWENVPDVTGAAERLKQHAADIKAIADAAHPSIVKRGGGLRSQEVVIVDGRYLKLQLAIDTQEAMGANMVDTICEAVAKAVQPWVNGELLFAVLSNDADQALVTATMSLDPMTIATKQMDGTTIAEKIVSITAFAEQDVYRAATHNKGIMNGVDAVVLAMGNDWRAIEAGAHSYASRDGHYRPLSNWQMQDGKLVGTLTMPMPIGSVGGATHLLPVVRINRKIVKINSAKVLAELIAGVGLAQNLAALRALVSSGIQAGHMALQATSLAITAGAKGDDIPKVAAKLQQVGRMDLATAKHILKHLR